MQLPPPAVFHDKAKRTQQGNLLRWPITSNFLGRTSKKKTCIWGSKSYSDFWHMRMDRQAASKVVQEVLVDQKGFWRNADEYYLGNAF